MTTTPSEARALALVATSRVLTNPQVARLMGISDVAARRHTRRLVGKKLLRDIPNVTRVTLQPLQAAAPEGKAPKAFTLTALGFRLARQMGFEPPAPPEYRERAIFLGHDVLAQEVRVELVEAGLTVTRWETGNRAYVGALRPDAWCSVELPGGRTLTAFIEADRGSESREVWAGKEARYAALLADGDALKAATGRRRAWTFVVAETERRAAQLSGWLGHDRMKALTVGSVARFVTERWGE